MPSTSNISMANEKIFFHFGIHDYIDLAIKTIFDAVENTPLHEEAVRIAMEKAAQRQRTPRSAAAAFWETIKIPKPATPDPGLVR